jgi:uncharacterized membrane protein YhhN
VFVLAGPLYLLVFVYDPPESFLIPFFIGGPSFLVAHILAIVALCSDSSWVKSCGKWTLQLIWGSIALCCGIAALAAALEIEPPSTLENPLVTSAH